VLVWTHNTNEPGDTLFQFTFFSDPTHRVLPGDIAGAGEFAPFLSLTPLALELQPSLSGYFSVLPDT
jgi:hypothetical protein